MKLSRLLLILPFLSGLPFPVLAANNQPAPAATNTTQSWYDIELIVFRYTDPHAGSLETWPADPGVPDWNAASALLVPPVAGNSTHVPAPAPVPASATTPTPLMQLDKYQLDYDWNRLKHSHDYEPLLHVAWVEPLSDHTLAPSIRIGVPPPAPVASNTGFAITPQTATPTTTPASAATPAPTPTLVYGTVKFSSYAPYLHLDLDLVYRGPLAQHVIAAPATGTLSVAAATTVAVPAAATQAQAAATDFQWYRMTQDRRIEAGKLNYFDNPMFGVLVLVTPHPLTAPVTQ